MFTLKILIVEDDSVSALLLQRALEKNAHQIVGIAETGEKALDIMEENFVDIVMMDINLAGELDRVRAEVRPGDRGPRKRREHNRRGILYAAAARRTANDGL